MKIVVKPGKYVLAVSGGVDSMVLLDLLAKRTDLELIVAHFNHGIRSDSAKDEQLVAKTAKRLRLAYEAGYEQLGEGVSEAAARTARYRFLKQVKANYKANGIITAHHQDDLIETAIINVLRGTRRRGLSAISANQEILRPMLGIPKSQILEYAVEHLIEWREDPTNQATDYLRNYIRLNIVPKLDKSRRRKLVKILDKVAKTNNQIDDIIATLSQDINVNHQINRYLFNSLPAEISEELVAYWLRTALVEDYDQLMVSRLSLAIKTAAPGTSQSVKKGSNMSFSDKSALFTNTLGKRRLGLI